MRVTLPPSDKYWLFHLASFFSHLSNTTFHTSSSLFLAPKGSPRYFVGNASTWQPNVLASSRRLSTWLIGKR
uniref:Putative ovule protein n=1 Tax=Solanum chacoense TaxID=4108 RepID=A0A0V0HLR3_SOLCH